jgi:hypothetical protein
MLKEFQHIQKSIITNNEQTEKEYVERIPTYSKNQTPRSKLNKECE